MPSISRLKCFGRAFWGLVIFELHLWAINTGQAKVNSSPRGCPVLSHQCLNLLDVVRCCTIQNQYLSFMTKISHFLHQKLDGTSGNSKRLVHDGCTSRFARFAFPDFSPQVAALIKLSKWELFNGQNLRCIIACTTSPSHLATIHQGKAHISVPSLFLEDLFWQGAKSKEKCKHGRTL